MTGAEIRRLLAFLVASYPRAEVGDETIQAYEVMLRDLPYREAQRAVVEHVATSRFWPTIAEIRTAVAEGSVAAPPVGVAWAEVRKQIAAVGRTGSPHFSHSLIAETVGSIGWRELCDSTSQTTDRAHFRDQYRQARTERVRGENLATITAARAPALEGTPPELEAPPPGERPSKRREQALRAAFTAIPQPEPSPVPGYDKGDDET